MKKRFAVIGLGYFGQRLALELSERGAEVIVIDNTMAKIEEIKNNVAYAIRLDSTDDIALRNQGLEELDAVIVTIGEDFESALLTCVHLLQYKCKRVFVKSTSPVHTKIFKSIGVHSIVSPEEIMAERLAMTLLSGNVLDSIPLTEEYSILQVKAPAHLLDQTLMQLDLRRKFEVNLITIKRSVITVNKKGEEETVESIIGVPQSDTMILKDDILVLLGREADISRLIED
jgi:trk system potassium uptake protein